MRSPQIFPLTTSLTPYWYALYKHTSSKLVEQIAIELINNIVQVEMWLYKLDEIANDIGEALTRADVELYLKAGKATYEAELLEKSLDPLIALIRDEQFGPNYPVDELEVFSLFL